MVSMCFCIVFMALFLIWRDEEERECQPAPRVCRLRKAVLHKDTASCQILNHAHVAKGSLHLPSNSMEIIAVPQNGILFHCFRRGVVRFFLFPESVKID